MKRALMMAAVTAVMLAGPATAATQVAEWDVNTSWDAENKVVDSSLAGLGGLVPQPGANYYADGAGPGDRAYLMLDQPSYVTVNTPAVNGSVFKASDGGYTEIGYYYLPATIPVTSHAGIGTAGAAVTWANVFLYVQNGTSSFRSCTSMYNGSDYWSSTGLVSGGVPVPSATQWHVYNPATDTWTTTPMGTNSQGIGTNDFGGRLFPASLRGQWIHIAKVHEICTDTFVDDEEVEHHYGEVRYYINGVLMGKEVYEYDLTGFNYVARSDTLGAIGSSAATVQGVGFSYFGAWSGILSDAEIMANYVALTTPVPEPATMALLALGGLAMLRRRK